MGEWIEKTKKKSVLTLIYYFWTLQFHHKALLLNFVHDQLSLKFVRWPQFFSIQLDCAAFLRFDHIFLKIKKNTTIYRAKKKKIYK